MGAFLDTDTTKIAYLLVALNAFWFTLYFGFQLFHYFTLRRLLKTLGFGLLVLAYVFILFFDPSSTLFFWLSAGGFYLLLLHLFFDRHAKLQIMFLPAILALLFVQQHVFLFIQTLLIAISAFHLAGTTTRHKDLISFGVGFLLMSIGEYFYFLESVHGYGDFQSAGALLQIFASFALINWAIVLVQNRWLIVKK